VTPAARKAREVEARSRVDTAIPVAQHDEICLMALTEGESVASILREIITLGLAARRQVRAVRQQHTG
jgi:hypothetical protein